MDARSLQLPLSESAVRSLRVGTPVQLTGTIFTARDAVHKYLSGGQPAPCDLDQAVIYHCGPVIVREGNRWHLLAAGPTTSIREEPYMADLIAAHGLRAVIGKGGMGARTLAACRRYGCVYLHAVGGAAQVLAQAVEEVETVYLLEEFGAPEAIWQLRVRDFPALVTMDAAGNSLHDQVRGHSERTLQDMLGVLHP